MNLILRTSWVILWFSFFQKCVVGADDSLKTFNFDTTPSLILGMYLKLSSSHQASENGFQLEYTKVRICDEPQISARRDTWILEEEKSVSRHVLGSMRHNK